MKKGRHSTPKAPILPQTVEQGANAIQSHALKLFATTNGEAVDWSMMAESLFRVAFHCLDRSTSPERRSSILRRLESAAYDGLAGNRPQAAPAAQAPAPHSHSVLDPLPPGPGVSF